MPHPFCAAPCKATLINRSLNLGNRRTCVRLDELTWHLLCEMAAREGVTVHKLCATIDQDTGYRASWRSSGIARAKARV